MQLFNMLPQVIGVVKAGVAEAVANAAAKQGWRRRRSDNRTHH